MSFSFGQWPHISIQNWKIIFLPRRIYNYYYIKNILQGTARASVGNIDKNHVAVHLIHPKTKSLLIVTSVIFIQYPVNVEMINIYITSGCIFVIFQFFFVYLTLCNK